MYLRILTIDICYYLNINVREVFASFGVPNVFQALCMTHSYSHPERVISIYTLKINKQKLKVKILFRARHQFAETDLNSNLPNSKVIFLSSAPH